MAAVSAASFSLKDFFKSFMLVELVKYGAYRALHLPSQGYGPVP